MAQNPEYKHRVLPDKIQTLVKSTVLDHARLNGLTPGIAPDKSEIGVQCFSLAPDTHVLVMALQSLGLIPVTVKDDDHITRLAFPMDPNKKSYLNIALGDGRTPLSAGFAGDPFTEPDEPSWMVYFPETIAIPAPGHVAPRWQVLVPIVTYGFMLSISTGNRRGFRQPPGFQKQHYERALFGGFTEVPEPLAEELSFPREG